MVKSTMQVAALTVYYEWQKSSEAAARKKEAERELEQQLRREADHQRYVCLSTPFTQTQASPRAGN
jgi:hypothetical protein